MNQIAALTPQLIGLVITMVFSAFFSGMEIAFVSSNRLRAEMDREKNGLPQKAIAFFYRHPNTFVSTMLVGNNIALVIYGILFAQIFDTLFFNMLFEGYDGLRVAADTIASTIVVLFTGEFLPKTIFKNNPNTMLTIFALPALLCYIVLYPISRFATFLSRIILRVFGVKIVSAPEDKEFSKVDLDYLVQSSIDHAKNEDEIESEVKIFHNALDFSDTKVRDCMIPRTEIEAIDIDDTTVEELKNRFIDSGFSKLIVYKEDIDHIVGYIHSSEMFRKPADWKQNVRTMPFVPETMAARKLMHIFMQQKKSLAVVVDEFGGTSGLVALEDIVEEIFGEIEDEHDTPQYVAKLLDTGEYLLSARLEIERVNEMFGLDLPESDEYMTVGGLILHEYQSFPKLNEVVNIGKFEFKIIKNTMTKIELVRLKVTE
ncbi:MAG: HlyC/CorC family transporter [Prevotella sp.]|nr:HlyC/CorC family transporter [Prevotella sp.]